MLDRARALLAGSFVWDNHACMPLRPGDDSFLPQVERARAAGCDAVTLNIGFGETGPDDHLAMLAAFRRWFSDRAERYRIIEQPADFDAARADGQLGICFDIEGARAVEGRMDLLPLFRAEGVQWMLIAYNRENAAGYGCLDGADEGLKPFGRSLVREMEAVGMTVCLTHTGHRTARDVLAMAQRPLIFSHSNCAAVHPHRRNIPDELIRACAETGGVVGINGVGEFLGPPGRDLAPAIVRHIDHVAQLVGPRHVGIALDYVYDRQELIDYISAHAHSFPDGFDPELAFAEPELLEQVVAGLLERGYAEADIALILGGNWRRISDAAL